MAAFTDNNKVCASIQFNVIFHVNSERKIYIPFPPPFSGRGERYSFFLHRPDRFWGPPSLLFNGCKGSLSSSVKRPGRETDDSPSSSVEVANECRYTSTGVSRNHFDLIFAFLQFLDVQIIPVELQ